MQFDENNIPINISCDDCGFTTWRKELGSADRFWHDGYVCKSCCAVRIIASKKSVDALQELFGWPRIYKNELDGLK